PPPRSRSVTWANTRHGTRRPRSPPSRPAAVGGAAVGADADGVFGDLLALGRGHEDPVGVSGPLDFDLVAQVDARLGAGLHQGRLAGGGVPFDVGDVCLVGADFILGHAGEIAALAAGVDVGADARGHAVVWAGG